MFNILDHLHHTADGMDRLPAWFLRLAAPVYSHVISELINRSISAAHVPEQWKTAVITPVAKVKKPEQMTDFRPISVTPVLSRVVERELVRGHLYQAFAKSPASEALGDQFAFRPTGSTTAALIAILQQTTDLLRSNKYVAIISLDFSRAFDTVRHSTLAEKLSALDIHDQVYNWLIQFLKGRQHVTRFMGQTSAPARINASAVQGSGVGPSFYSIDASDLQPLHPTNVMVKYADDTYLLVGSTSRATVCEELRSVSDWATSNNLKLNANKSREMLIMRRGSVEQPPLLDGVQRVESMKILGVTFRNNLSATPHVEEIIGACSGSLHALRILRSHGLSREALNVVAEATTISRLLYAAPAWWGYVTAADRQRLERLLSKTARLELLSVSEKFLLKWRYISLRLRFTIHWDIYVKEVPQWRCGLVQQRTVSSRPSRGIETMRSS